MDDMCARAVREAFFQLFKDGLIYRGKRLVNWDPATQTALADDEVEMRDVDGHFWYLKYPLAPGSEPVSGVHGDGGAGVARPSWCPDALHRARESLGEWLQRVVQREAPGRVAERGDLLRADRRVEIAGIIAQPEME